MRVAIVSLLACALAVAVATAEVPAPVLPPAAPANLGAPVFVVTGGGYGHGVGLNQYGALAQARAGRTYRDILSFYYPGTDVTPAARSKVRVLLADGRRSVTVSSPTPFRVRDAAGASYSLPAGRLAVGRSARVLPVEGGTRKKLQWPLVFLPRAGATLSLDDKRYRGELDVSAEPGGLRVVNNVRLDAYLQGVVPGEMPKEWPLEALKAQAVAARSYALASLVEEEPWDLYADSRSQVYYGVEAESPSTTRAVAETRGELLSYGGKVAAAFYYSSSGGKTASSKDVFGVPYRYLQARNDPWDDASPYHRWEPRRFTGIELGRALGLKAAIVDAASLQTPSARPARVTLITGSGGVLTYYGADVRTRLGLRSTAFRLGVMRLSRPPASSPPGAPVELEGLARDVEQPVLERRVPGGWTRVARLGVRADGSFATTVRPVETTTYRLVGSSVAGPSVTIAVAGSAGPS